MIEFLEVNLVYFQSRCRLKRLPPTCSHVNENKCMTVYEKTGVTDSRPHHDSSHAVQQHKAKLKKLHLDNATKISVAHVRFVLQPSVFEILPAIERRGCDLLYNRWGNSQPRGKPRRQQILFCDIQIKVVISHRQVYVYHTDLLPLKI